MRSNDKLVSLIKELSNYPELQIVDHLSLAMGDYTIQSISDKQLTKELEAYISRLEMDSRIPHSQDIEDIIRDGLNLMEDE